MIGGEFRIGVLVAGLLLLAGCSGDSKGVTPLPAETSATSAAVVTTQASPPPVAPVAEKTAKGAEQFVRYFWAVYDYSYDVLRTDELATISQPDCKFCSSTASEIVDFASSSTRREGADITIETVLAPPVKNPDRILVMTIINQEKGQTITSAGVKSGIPSIRQARASIALEWRDSSWQIHGVSIETN
jgi:hypothetical protein